MSAFKYYIGIDYSGAKAPVSRLAQLQVYESKVNSVPKRVEPYDKGAKNWCRKEVAKYVHSVTSTTWLFRLSPWGNQSHRMQARAHLTGAESAPWAVLVRQNQVLICHL